MLDEGDDRGCVLSPCSQLLPSAPFQFLNHCYVYNIYIQGGQTYPCTTTTPALWVLKMKTVLNKHT